MFKNLLCLFLDLNDAKKTDIHVKGTKPENAYRLVFTYTKKTQVTGRSPPAESKEQITAYTYFNQDDAGNPWLNFLVLAIYLYYN